jgi:hypothetical protein
MSEQSMKALAVANEVRLGQAAWRRETAQLSGRDGRMLLARLLEQEEELPRSVGAMPMDRFLRAARRTGPEVARSMLQEANIAHQRVRDLTPGERRRLAQVLRRRAEYCE